ncbi:MAG: EI24 domain-containing protein [bacterium]
MARGGFFAGPRVLGRGFGMLRKHRSLWPWAALPFLLNLAAFALAIWAFVANLDAIAGPIERMLDPGEPSAWWGWAWAGPLLLAVLARWLLLAALGVAIYFLFTVVGALIAAPFLDVLSERVERIAGGLPAREGGGFGDLLRVALRSVIEEGKRTLFFVVVQLTIVLFGLFPGVQPIAALASLAFTALFLPLDYTAYAFDRRRVPFRVRRRWIAANLSEMLGFGAFGLALFFVPGLSFLCLPWLVTSGTLLVLELPLPAKPD